ncbi:MAG: hypothetical protein ACEPOW_01170 [Bacteroidales bacterium]
MIRKIAIIMAMREEAATLIEDYNLQKVDGVFDSCLPMEVYRNRAIDVQIDLILNGKDPVHQVESIGTENAVISTMSVIQELKPDLIINAGTAGGFACRGGKIGEVYTAKSGVYFHDRRIPLGDYEKMGLGAFPCIELTDVSSKFGLKQGVVTTGSSLDYSDHDKCNVDSYSGELKDMEAAAIAKICSYYQQPLVIFKSITDIVDGPHPTHKEFLSNLSQASKNLSNALHKFINYCIGKNLSDLH